MATEITDGPQGVRKCQQLTKNSHNCIKNPPATAETIELQINYVLFDLLTKHTAGQRNTQQYFHQTLG